MSRKNQSYESNRNMIPYIVHESDMARMERQIKRLWIALIITISMLFLCFVSLVWIMNSYDYQSYELSTDGGGNANFIGNDGDIINGTGESQEAS